MTTVAGFQADVRRMTDDDRRTASLAVLVAVLVLAGIGLALHYLARDAATALWAVVVLVVLALAYLVAVFLYAARAAPAATAAATAPPADASASPESAWAPPAPDAAPAGEPQVLTLRCGECSTVFDVTDTGVRPLYHTCPGCGAEGVLRAPAEVPPATTPESSPLAPPATADATAPATPTSRAAAKSMKLRCGACKHVFQIEDTGERPLRHRCPNCAKLGEIR